MIGLILCIVGVILLVMLATKLMRPSKSSALHRNLNRKTVGILKIVVFAAIVVLAVFFFKRYFPKGLAEVKDGKFVVNAPQLKAEDDENALTLSIRKSMVTVNGKNYEVQRAVPEDLDAILTEEAQKGKDFVLIDDYALNDTFKCIEKFLESIDVAGDRIAKSIAE